MPVGVCGGRAVGRWGNERPQEPSKKVRTTGRGWLQPANSSTGHKLDRARPQVVGRGDYCISQTDHMEGRVLDPRKMASVGWDSALGSWQLSH